MEVLAKGQLSYMILSCLSERDMYGLELIDEIQKRYGREIKLPSLYSNINRMKELKYISSYLKESNKGPKCSYSSITEAGRKALENLKQDFGGLNVVKETTKEEKPVVQETKEEFVSKYDEEDEIEKSDDYDDYFAIANDEEESSTQSLETKQESVFDEEKEEGFPIEKENIPPLIQEIEEEKEEEQEVETVEPAKETTNISTIDSAEYNRRLYNASRDFSRNKNKRSYTENQIELAISPSIAKSTSQQEQDLAELKTALLQSKEGHYQEIKRDFKTYNALQNALSEEKESVDKEIVEVKHDDGVFITDRLPDEFIPKPKRIEPPRLNITLPSSNYDKKLPAPKRNVAVDPTCSDVRSKIESLYAKAEVKKEPEKQMDEDFEDYDQLSSYYQSQGVDFKVYERPEARPRHNTNLLNFYVSLFVFGLIGVGCGLMYLIFSLCNLTTASTNFVYYLFPIFALIYVVYSYYNYKTSVSKVPKQMWHPVIVWSLFALFVALIFLLNYACGAAFDQVRTYFSTILVPIYAAGCGTIGIYYSQIYAYKKFWK